MIIEGRAVVIAEDDVNTDVLYPGPFLNIDDPEEMKNHLFEGLDPALRDLLGGDTVLVVGSNFGGGSSREHVPLAMKAWGIRAVIGASFARIFFRNCINLGLPVLTCGEAVHAARANSKIRILAERGVIEVDGAPHRTASMPPFVVEMMHSGGLVPWVRERLGLGGGPAPSASGNDRDAE
jgi:3-isopropylmalate/(R)-2-methylmalate dehydratase small subunit